MEGETATDLIEGELCYYLSMAESAAEKQDSILLYCWMNSEDAYSDLYLLDCNNGSLKEADFTPVTRYDHISDVYRDAEGHALLCTEDTLYYLTLSELNFTSYQ